MQNACWQRQRTVGKFWEVTLCYVVAKPNGKPWEAMDLTDGFKTKRKKPGKLEDMDFTDDFMGRNGATKNGW